MFGKSVGISNLKIEMFIEKSSNADFKANCAGVFASDKMNHFVNFHCLREKKVLDIHPLFQTRIG